MLFVCLAAAAGAEAARPRARRAGITTRQLEILARDLKGQNAPRAYARLSVLALRRSSGLLGKRAALALGYYDYGRGKYDQAAKWLDRAEGDPLLRSYALYWKALADIGRNRSADALAELEKFRRDYPDSVMTEQALQALGEAALDANQPLDAVKALDGYSRTKRHPDLLFLRGEAREQAGLLTGAASDYQAVYLRYPLSDQADDAGQKLDFLRSTPGVQVAPAPLDERMYRARALFNTQHWSEAKDQYAQVLPELSGAELERARLRILECGVELGDNPSALAALKISDPDVDAERYRALAAYYRSQQNDAQMVAAVNSAVSRAPKSYWAESALFLAGNYYWVQLDRDKAAHYYGRVIRRFPKGRYADVASWRIVWTAVLKRQSDAAKMLEEHLRRFPDSPYTPDTLYWLGRLAERARDRSLARGFYASLTRRFPQTYFASQGAARLRRLGSRPRKEAAVLAAIPRLPATPQLADPVLPSVAVRLRRAQALRSIAFDASADLEFRAAYTVTKEPRLLLDAAEAAVAAQNYGEAIVAIRRLYPDLESRSFSAVPQPVWRVAYAFPFKRSIRRWSEREGLDPMLVAGLIHQESAFDPDALSVSNAIGLMQLLPTTARRLARQARIRYSTARLTQPEYNMRLGTLFLANLRKQFGSMEEAIAAYNAGKNRVTAWTDDQPYQEPAEFVESIPFTQTRNYVQIVLRNAAIYRHLYRARYERREIRDHRRR